MSTQSVQPTPAVKTCETDTVPWTATVGEPNEDIPTLPVESQESVPLVLDVPQIIRLEGNEGPIPVTASCADPGVSRGLIHALPRSFMKHRRTPTDDDFLDQLATACLGPAYAFDRMSRRYSEMRKKLSEAELENSKLQDQLHTATEKITSLESEVKKSADRIVVLEDESSNLKARLSASDLDSSAHSSKISYLENTIVGLNAEVTDFEAEHKEDVRLNDGWNTSYQIAQGDISDLREWGHKLVKYIDCDEPVLHSVPLGELDDKKVKEEGMMAPEKNVPLVTSDGQGKEPAIPTE